jgi:hypothetical protein
VYPVGLSINLTKDLGSSGHFTVFVEPGGLPLFLGGSDANFLEVLIISEFIFSFSLSSSL